MKNNLKETISKEYSKIYSVGSSMHDYCMSKFSNAVIFDNGMIYVFKKPKIEKDFCFGFYSVYNEDDCDEVQNMVEHAKNDGGEYFMQKNLEQFDNFEDWLKDMGEGHIFAVLSYNGESNICGITDYRCYEHDKYYVLTKEDVEKLIEANKSERAKFEKRLNTYLKKYGTSKLHTWSYWKDA